MANSTACSESFRWTEEMAMITLASPTAVTPRRCTRAMCRTSHLARTCKGDGERAAAEVGWVSERELDGWRGAGGGRGRWRNRTGGAEGGWVTEEGGGEGPEGGIERGEEWGGGTYLPDVRRRRNGRTEGKTNKGTRREAAAASRPVDEIRLWPRKMIHGVIEPEETHLWLEQKGWKHVTVPERRSFSARALP